MVCSHIASSIDAVALYGVNKWVCPRRRSTYYRADTFIVEFGLKANVYM